MNGTACLQGKRALVCGASQGIGRAIAIALAAVGAEVVVLARNADKLQQLLPQLQQANSQGNHGFLQLDLSDAVNLKKTVTAEIDHNSGFDIVINNAGGPAPGNITDAAAQDFQKAFNMHVIANAALAEILLPHMKAKGYGRIINIISTSVKAPIDNLGVSNTIRAAVASWAKTLSYEVAEYGITVNNVLPGFIATERLDAIINKRADMLNISANEAEQMLLSMIPAKKFGKPEDIAAVVAFLASPAANYVNGVNLAVDGGRTRAL